MITVKHKRLGRDRSGTTWVVGLDVHEVPDLAELKPTEENAAKWRSLNDRYRGGPDIGDEGGGELSFFLGELTHIDQVKEQFDKGWAEGGAKALQLADGLIDQVSQPVSIRRRIRYSDDGDEFDKERLIDGHLDTAWRTTTRQLAVATPIINIACAWGGNADRSHGQLFWSGAAAIALIRLLEEAGYQTSLTAVCTNDLHASDKGIAIACRVKQAGEYLRPDAVASTICFAPTYRTYLFLSWLSGPYRVPMGLGHHCRVEHLIPDVIDAGVMYSPQIILPDVYNEKGAKQAVNDALAELQAANLASLPEEFTR